MKKQIKRNKYYTPQEYKDMSQEKLIDIFYPLISKLSHDFGDKRFSEDVKQDVIVSLLECQRNYDPSIGANFGAYCNSYMRWSAKCSRQRNFSSIDVPYTSMIQYQQKGQINQQHTIPILIHNDDDGNNSTLDPFLSCFDKEHPDYRDDNLFATIKIILGSCKEGSTSEEYSAIKDYLRLVIDGKTGNKKFTRITNKIKSCLKDTILSNPSVLRSLAHSKSSGESYCPDEYFEELGFKGSIY